jgi:hypothetical protein
LSVAGGNWKWKIVTRKGREIEVEAPYVTESEVKIMSALLDAIFDELENYILEFEIIFGGQRQAVQAKFRRAPRGSEGEGEGRGRGGG